MMKRLALMTSDDYKWTYEELRDMDYDYDSYLEYLERKYRISYSFDADDMEYAPLEYWESGL
jgi:hypothetical protein